MDLLASRVPSAGGGDYWPLPGLRHRRMSSAYDPPAARNLVRPPEMCAVLYTAWHPYWIRKLLCYSWGIGRGRTGVSLRGARNQDRSEATGASPSPLRSERVRAVYAGLLTAILDHRLPPGTRLPEDEIGAAFGASRTIVRAALQALAHERVVVVEPNRGAQVAHPTVEEARQVFEVRSLLEPRAAALAAERATKADVAALRRHLKEEQAALAADNRHGAIALSASFHIRIAEIAAHRILEGFIRELTSRSSLVVALYWHRRDTICERHAHAALVDAIGGGQGERAADLMRSHLVDLLSGLDLGRPPPQPRSLAALLLSR